MKETLTATLALLEEQRLVQERLLALSEEKQQVILRNDTERLREIVAEEYQLLGRMKTIEKRRLSQAEAFARETGVPVEDVTVSLLSDHAEGEDRKHLLGLQAALLKLLTELRRLNELNHGLLETQLQYTGLMLSAIGDTADPLNNFYGTDGKSSSADIRSGSGLFDTEI